MIALWDTVLTCLERHQPNQQILQKKGRGRIIHISDFVEEENGHLIVCDGEENIIKDAREIIYPGTVLRPRP